MITGNVSTLKREHGAYFKSASVLKSGTLASASEGTTRQSFNVMSRGHAYYEHALEDLKLLDRFDRAFLTPVQTNNTELGRG